MTMQSSLSQPWRRMVPREYKPRGTRERPIRITKREEQTLHYLLAGYSNKKIGATLGVTEGTIKCYIHRLLHKLGADSRLHLTCLFRMMGTTDDRYSALTTAEGAD